MMRQIRKIIVHHSAGRDTTTAAEVRADHVTRRGWSDIGYHWWMRRESSGSALWLVEQGRPEATPGAHDSGENADSIGVCLAGDYSHGRAVPAEAWRALVDHVAAICRRYGLAAAAVRTHEEDEPPGSATECAGFAPTTLRAAVGLHLAMLDG
jgi:hypothetical protein